MKVQILISFWCCIFAIQGNLFVATGQKTDDVEICADKSNSCAVHAEEVLKLCKFSFIKEQCQKTCMLCPEVTTAPPSSLYRGECGKPKFNPGLMLRITGGTDAKYGAIPWQVGIKQKFNDSSLFFRCGGTLISREHIVTAASCITGAKLPLLAYLGKHRNVSNLPDHGQLVVEISNITEHPQFDLTTFDNDLALLTMSSPVDFTDYIRPACMPKQNEEITPGKMALASGWGLESPSDSQPSHGVMQQVELPIISNMECNIIYLTQTGLANRITPNMICAGYLNGGKDACVGDGGGPLVVRHKGSYFLVGVISWGVGCGERPGVYTKVSKKVDWINAIIE
ncbi:trypsin-1-like [Clavelina lepadiformis]|uniref:trypsin-1-like n=1 Tax=Clavelina lepadiformis TaxID=159417 RepID=UPI0040426BF6